jgi:uncharacterized protein
MLDLTDTPDGIVIRLKVVPGASRDRIVGEHDGALKITVSAAPEKGKANKAITKLLAKALGARANQIEIARGATSPNKTLLIRDVPDHVIQSLV